MMHGKGTHQRAVTRQMCDFLLGNVAIWLLLLTGLISSFRSSSSCFASFVAILYLHLPPRIEIVTFQQFRPTSLISSLHCLSDQCTVQTHTTTYTQQLKLLLRLLLFWPVFQQLHRFRRFTHQILCQQLIHCISLPHPLNEASNPTIWPRESF